MKRLVCFFDGTWNKPEDADQTNVVKLQRAIPAADAGGIAQVVHYEVGIATELALGRAGPSRSAPSASASAAASRAAIASCARTTRRETRSILSASRAAPSRRAASAGLIALAGIAAPPPPEAIADAWDCYERNKLARNPGAGEGAARGRTLPGPHQVRGRVGHDRQPRHPVRQEGPHQGAAGVSRHRAVAHRRCRPARSCPSTSRAGPSARRCGPSRRAPRCRRARSSSRSGSPAATPTSAAATRTARCPTSRCCGWPSASRRRRGSRWTSQHLRATTKPDPLGEQVSPTSDGIYRVSYLLPFVRLIKQNRKGISAFRRAILGSWRTSALPSGQVPVNESIHDSAMVAVRQARAAAPRRGGERDQVPTDGTWRSCSTNEPPRHRTEDALVACETRRDALG